MAKLLSHERDFEVMEVTLDAVEALDITIEEILPGLVASIIALANTTQDPQRLLDEAVDLLTEETPV